jgi:GAF domain-containing protein
MTDDGGDGAEATRAAALDLLIALAVRLHAADRIAPPREEAVLRAIADASAVAMRVTAVSVALLDAATGRLVFRVAAGPEGRGVVGLEIAAHEGIAGYVHSTGQPLAIADVVADPRFERTTAERTGYLPRSLLAVPLVDDEGALGVMEFLDRRDGSPFDLADLETGRRFAAAVSASIRATRLDHDAVGLFAATLVAIGAGAPGSGSPPLDGPAIDALVAAVAERLDDGDPLWRLADGIGHLREADRDDVELAIDWLDALLAHMRRREALGR